MNEIVSISRIVLKILSIINGFINLIGNNPKFYGAKV